MANLKKTLICVALAAMTLTFAERAVAGPIHPDLSLLDLSVAYNGTNFSASSQPGGSVLSWTKPDGSFGGASIGNMTLTWNGSTGTISVYDLLLDSQLLVGTTKSLSPTLFSPGGAFVLKGALTTTALGLGNSVRITVGSSDFLSGSGIGQADLVAVPEPMLLTLMLFGSGAAAVRARRSRRS